MRSFLKLASAARLALILGGCGSLPPEASHHSSRISVRRVCLASLGVPDRAQVTITNPVGAGFGVVGTLIESHRAASAQQEMQAVLAKASYDYQSALASSVFVAMSKAGFTMVRSSESRPEKERSRFLAHYPEVQRVDAFLD